MFNSNKARSLTDYEMSELMDLVSKMFDQMLSTGEQVIKVVDKYGLVVSINYQGENYQGCIFELRRCEIYNEGIELHNPPLFVGQRHMLNMKDFQNYIDEKALEELIDIHRQATLYIAGLIKSIKINHHQSQQTEYQMPSLHEHEERQIVDTMKQCLREAMNEGQSFGKIEELDLLFMVTYENNTTSLALFKLSDCFLLGGEIPVELPSFPIYLATLDQQKGFNGTANNEFEHSKFEKYYQYVNACLSSSVKTY